VAETVAGPRLLSEGFAIRGCELRKESDAKENADAVASLKVCGCCRWEIQDGFHDVLVGGPCDWRNLCCSRRHGELAVDGGKKIPHGGQPRRGKERELDVWVLEEWP
jgi:hypothetical protein